MLQIRGEQLEAFQQDALAAFEDEMMAHSREFSPLLCGMIGDEQLRAALRGARIRAAGYGFTNRGAIRLFIELMFLLGSAFDSDPQYPWAARILRASGDQMHRAEELFCEIIAYHEKVLGADDANTHQALREIAILAKNPPEISSAGFVPGMLGEVTRIFPQKAEYVGKECMTALIHEASAEARRYQLPAVQGDVLFVFLMYLFGHGFASDPLHPWIASTLTDARIIQPEARIARLQKKAMTWLDHLLAASGEGK